jgi:hypothetical protein
MSHPEDHLFADYVDGTLSEPDRRALDEHLASCARCRSEVALAADAGTALASLAQVPAPGGVADGALREARRAAVPAPPPAWFRWWAVAAVAAALVLGVALAIPRLGGTGEERATSDSLGTATAAPEAADAGAARRGVEIRDEDYTTADLQALALSARASGVDAAAAQAALGKTTYAVSDVPAARQCLATAYPPEKSDPVRLIDARFEHTPAYIGLFVDGPGGDKPARSVVVVVAAKDDCRVLSTTTTSG